MSKKVPTGSWRAICSTQGASLSINVQNLVHTSVTLELEVLGGGAPEWIV